MPPEEVEDDLSAVESIPRWFWIMLAGIVGITAFSVVVRVLLPDEESPRGIIALLQLAIGLISMMVAHGIAAKFALASDRRLNFNDVLLSWFNIWQPTVAKLPGTCRQLQTMAWGGFAVLTAVTIIGGIDWSAPFRVHEKPPEFKPMEMVAAVAGAAKAQAGKQPATMEEAMGELQSQTAQMQQAAEDQAAQGGPKTLEEAFAELGKIEDQLPAELTLDDLENIPLTDEVEVELYTLDCVLYGVETDERNVPQAFLFAANRQGKDQHVCSIRTEDLPRREFRTIAVQLSTAIEPTTDVETTHEAVWVRHIVSCRIAFRGLTETGEFRDPEFEARVVRQRGTLDSEPPKVQRKSSQATPDASQQNEIPDPHAP